MFSEYFHLNPGNEEFNLEETLPPSNTNKIIFHNTKNSYKNRKRKIDFMIYIRVRKQMRTINRVKKNAANKYQLS